MAEAEQDPDAQSTVVTLRDSAKAQLLRMALEGAGIQAWLSTENLASVAPHLGIAIGIDVNVRHSDLLAARELMMSVESGEVALPEDSDLCPACGGSETERVSAPHRTGALLGQLFVGVPRPDIRWSWTCGRCGHSWR